MMTIISLAVMLFQSSGWDLLEDVKFKTAYSEELETYVDMPKFGEDLLQLEGTQIKVKGYYMPLDLESESTIILSKYPYASCFFCGGAGLESVVEVQFSEPQRTFKLDEVLTVSGRLKLNKDDFGHLVFMLEDAERMMWEE